MGPLPVQQIHLVVAIQVVLVGAVTEFHTFQQLIGDVGISRSSHKCR